VLALLFLAGFAVLAFLPDAAGFKRRLVFFYVSTTTNETFGFGVYRGNRTGPVLPTVRKLKFRAGPAYRTYGTGTYRYRLPFYPAGPSVLRSVSSGSRFRFLFRSVNG